MQVDLPQAQVCKEDDSWKGGSASRPEGLLAPGGLIVAEPFKLQPVPPSRLRVSRAAVGTSQLSLAFPEANAGQREWSAGEASRMCPGNGPPVQTSLGGYNVCPESYLQNNTPGLKITNCMDSKAETKNYPEMSKPRSQEMSTLEMREGPWCWGSGWWSRRMPAGPAPTPQTSGPAAGLPV